MDIALLRTFLEVHRVRPFRTCRGKPLHHAVGGQRLLPHAETVLSEWQRAIRDVGMQQDSRSLVVIGAEPPIWNLFLSECFERVYRESNDVALAVQAHSAEQLHRRLDDGMVNVAFGYQPLLQEGGCGPADGRNPPDYCIRLGRP